MTMTDIDILGLSDDDRRGFVLPGSSNLVQFIVERQAHGIYAPAYPFVVWVDRRPGSSMRSCGAQLQSWTLVMCADGSLIQPAPGTLAGVCLCMGSFIE